MKDLYESIILVVDDSPVNIDILVAILEGYEMKTAINGEDALKSTFDESPPDLILLDIMMPKMDGYEVCRRLRADDRAKEIPIIFVTAKIQKEDIIKGFELGGQDYITKPFDTRELKERVKVQLKLKIQREFLKTMNMVLEEKVNERTSLLNESINKLDYANKKLLVLDEAKNQFLWMISHEIRTPLNGILGPMNFLSDLIDNPDLQEMLEVVNESAKRLEKVSKLALDITQMQIFGSKMARSQIDFQSVIEKSILSSLPKANEKELTFSTTYQGEGRVSAVENCFEQCIEELIDNAIKFSNEAQIISISTFNEQGKLILNIANTGATIPPDKIEDIVKPFGLGSEHSDRHLGLGLHYVQTFLNIHQASMAIQSNNQKTEISLIFNLDKS